MVSATSSGPTMHSSDMSSLVASTGPRRGRRTISSTSHGELRAVEQHHRGAAGTEVLAAVVVPLPRVLGLAGEDRLCVAEGQVGQLGDVAEDEHVGVEVERPPLVPAELRDHEPAEGELRAGPVLLVLAASGAGRRASGVNSIGMLDVLADRVLEHAVGDDLGLVGADEDAQRLHQRRVVDVPLLGDRAQPLELRCRRRRAVREQGGCASRSANVARVAAAAVDAERCAPCGRPSRRGCRRAASELKPAIR